jgi:adenylate cyclase
MDRQEHRVERRLAAILATDVVGASGLMEADEAGTLSAIQSILSEIIEPAASWHGGRIVKTMGDGALLEFARPVEAVLLRTHENPRFSSRADIAAGCMPCPVSGPQASALEKQSLEVSKWPGRSW